MPKGKTMKGFTLIEILVVVALIAILTAITFIAINPAKNFADTRNAQRSSDVGQILNAVTQYTSESGHTLATLTGAGTAVPQCSVGALHIGTDSGLVDLNGLVDAYIVGIPWDPIAGVVVGGVATDTGYTICTTTTAGVAGRITVDAPSAENSKVITVKR